MSEYFCLFFFRSIGMLRVVVIGCTVYITWNSQNSYFSNNKNSIIYEPRHTIMHTMKDFEFPGLLAKDKIHAFDVFIAFKNFVWNSTTVKRSTIFRMTYCRIRPNQWTNLFTNLLISLWKRPILWLYHCRLDEKCSIKIKTYESEQSNRGWTLRKSIRMNRKEQWNKIYCRHRAIICVIIFISLSFAVSSYYFSLRDIFIWDNDDCYVLLTYQ